MDISAVSTLANSNNTSAVADKLKNNVKNLSSDSTEDELKSTLKDFESYFVEQVIKEMKDSMTQRVRMRIPLCRSTRICSWTLS